MIKIFELWIEGDVCFFIDNLSYTSFGIPKTNVLLKVATRSFLSFVPNHTKISFLSTVKIVLMSHHIPYRAQWNVYYSAAQKI